MAENLEYFDGCDGFSTLSTFIYSYGLRLNAVDLLYLIGLILFDKYLEGDVIYFKADIPERMSSNEPLEEA